MNRPGIPGDSGVQFESGSRFQVPSHPHYEAWNVSGPGTFLVVCMPGGGDAQVAIWDEMPAD